MIRFHGECGEPDTIHDGKPCRPDARKWLREVRKLGGAFKKAFIKKHGMDYVVQTGVFDVEEYARAMAAALEKEKIEWCIKVR